MEDYQESTNYYYTLWISDEFNGLWNVIQVIEGKARYYVLTGSLEEAKVGYMLSAGYVEDGWFTDGSDYDSLEKWTLHEGTLIPL